MLMPLDRLRAIYELLFREGVMVAKKDPRPQSLHPQVPGATNLQVIRVMGSLKSRGLVRETFAWRHFYWYLTNEGIAHLRQYLHLPPEIVPVSLQRARRPSRARPGERPGGRRDWSGSRECGRPQPHTRECVCPNAPPCPTLPYFTPSPLSLASPPLPAVLSPA
uniref:Plectin/eS10 N-terminal domain-containing protein n=1 Tax=Ornithorhynchus anatinus TaxID=9258 RepID=A0A6I8N0E7_ORNAN